MTTLSQVKERYTMRWIVEDFHGGYIAYRRHSVAQSAARYGLVNVLGSDTLENLAEQLAAQERAEKLGRSM